MTTKEIINKEKEQMLLHDKLRDKLYNDYKELINESHSPTGTPIYFSHPNKDKEVNGAHYREKTGIDLFEMCRKGLITDKEYIGALKFTAIKYILRCENKGKPEQDLDKAIMYIKELQEVIS